MQFFKKHKHLFLFIALSFVYFLSRVWGLLKLPVFADEAIYIRWAQLIMDEPLRYLFFPLNDGKTPLFVWALIPFQYFFADPLFAARFTSVCIGFLQMIVVMKLIKVLGGSKTLEYMGASFVILAPFWYFHHRMALMDGLLTLGISLTTLFFSEVFILRKRRTITDARSIKLIILAGVSFGLALLSKIPAILAAPTFFLVSFLDKRLTIPDLIQKKLVVLAGLGIGVVLFGLLYFSPSFGQLFGRGSDFLYAPSELLSGEKIGAVFKRLPSIFGYFWQYSSVFMYIAITIGLFTKKYQNITHIFFWSGVLFILPIALLGQVVYPRYVFPAVFFFTIAGVFSMGAIIDTYIIRASSLIRKSFAALILALLLANIYSTGVVFAVSSITDSGKTPFVAIDTVQYLTEWSSGHGIFKAQELIVAESAKHSIAVGTEGYFGTLPDGLLLYFHRKSVQNIYIEGIGYPVGNIPANFLTRAKTFDKQWIVVNSHRMNLNLDRSLLVAEYCRPFDAPCLQVWDITEVIDALPVSGQ